MFELQDGVTLGLYPRTELAKDANEPLGVPSPTEFNLGHLVQSREEVDALIKTAAIDCQERRYHAKDHAVLVV